MGCYTQDDRGLPHRGQITLSILLVFLFHLYALIMGSHVLAKFYVKTYGHMQPKLYIYLFTINNNIFYETKLKPKNRKS